MQIEAGLWVILISSLAWASTPSAEQPPTQVAVSFSLTASVVTLQEPVLVRYTIRNGFSQTVRIDFGASIESAFRFRIVDPSKKSWDISPPLQSGIMPVPRWQLSPGQSRPGELLLDKWFRFDQPGSYEIDSAVAVAVTTTSGKVIPQTATATLDLVVRPRDEEQLRQRCQSLAREAMRTSNAASALRAGEILSYIDDPVAVPHLAEVVRKSWGASHLGVEGLARIQSVPAVQSMIGLLKKPQVSQEGDRVAIVQEDDGFVLKPLTSSLKDLHGVLPADAPQDFEEVRRATIAKRAAGIHSGRQSSRIRSRPIFHSAARSSEMG